MDTQVKHLFGGWEGVADKFLMFKMALDLEKPGHADPGGQRELEEQHLP